MPLSRTQMPQISILASEDTQLYPHTQKSQKTPFKRVSAYAPLSPGISIRAYAHIRTHVYIIICPCMHLSPHLCICISVQLYAVIWPCVHVQTYTYTHIHTWKRAYTGMGLCVYLCAGIWVGIYGYMQICLCADIDRQTCTVSQLYAPGTPLRGKRSGGGCQEQLNVCLIV